MEKSNSPGLCHSSPPHTHTHKYTKCLVIEVWQKIRALWAKDTFCDQRMHRQGFKGIETRRWILHVFTGPNRCGTSGSHTKAADRNHCCNRDQKSHVYSPPISLIKQKKRRTYVKVRVLTSSILIPPYGNNTDLPYRTCCDHPLEGKPFENSEGQHQCYPSLYDAKQMHVANGKANHEK